MTKEELIIGEIYKFNYEKDYYYIFKYFKIDDDIKIMSNYYVTNHFTLKYIKNESYLLSTNDNSINNLELASLEEKHWLNECIKLDKFILFDEAMKTFNKIIEIY